MCVPTSAREDTRSAVLDRLPLYALHSCPSRSRGALDTQLRAQDAQAQTVEGRERQRRQSCSSPESGVFAPQARGARRGVRWRATLRRQRRRAGGQVPHGSGRRRYGDRHRCADRVRAPPPRHVRDGSVIACARGHAGTPPSSSSRPRRPSSRTCSLFSARPRRRRRRATPRSPRQPEALSQPEALASRARPRRRGGCRRERRSGASRGCAWAGCSSWAK